MYKCSLFRSYFILFNSLNMSFSNMLLRRKTNAKGGVVEKLAVKRAFSGRELPKEKVPPNPQDSGQNPWIKRAEGKKVKEAVVIESSSPEIVGGGILSGRGGVERG